MTTTIKSQLEKWAAIIGGKAWGVDKFRPRIYMPSRKDCQVFFDLADDAAYSDPAQEPSATAGFFGHALKIYIDDCNQHPNWYAGQKRSIAAAKSQASLALSALVHFDADAEPAGESLARRIMDLDDLEYIDVDAIAGHMTNGRLAETEAMIAAAEQED